MKTLFPLLSGITAFGAVVLGAASAGAQMPPSSPASSMPVEGPLSWVDPPAARLRGYRSSLLLADGIAFAVALPVSVGAFAAAPDDRLVTALTAMLALSPLALTGPLVHLTRGNGWRALASLGMRVGFFSAGTMLGGALRGSCDYTGPCESAVLAGVLGATMVAPALLDAFLFTEGERSASGRSKGSLPTPLLHVGSDGAHVGLGGSF